MTCECGCFEADHYETRNGGKGCDSCRECSGFKMKGLVTLVNTDTNAVEL